MVFHTQKSVCKGPEVYTRLVRKLSDKARLRLMAAGAAKREQVSDPLWWWEICKWLQLSEYRGSSVSHQAEHSYGTAAVGDSDNPGTLLRWRHFIFFASGPNPSLYYPCSICLPWVLYTWFVLFLSRLKYHSPPCSMSSAWHEWRMSTSCLAPSFLLVGSWQEMHEREGRLGISSIVLDCGQKEWSMKNTEPAGGTVWSS